MSKFSDIIERIGIDKVLHILVCIIVAIIGQQVFFRHLLPGTGFATYINSMLAGAMVSWLVGCAKETYDEFCGGSPDGYDLGADAIGAVIGAVIGALLCI